MALRGIQEYIDRDANNIARVEGQHILVNPEKEPSNIIITIIIIHIGLCVSSYYFTIVSDCQLPFCLFTNRLKKKRVQSSRMRRVIIVGHPNSYDKS